MESLSSHYSRFRVSERVLLTGHSHQAWPDVSFEAQQRAWLDAAALVDDKWERAAAVADQVRAGFRRLLNDPDGEIALGQNTHELLVRLLSAVLARSGGSGRGLRGFQYSSDLTDPTHPTKRATRLVTTDGEFHTIRRQLDRLAEEGLEVLRIAARPADSLAARLAARVDDRTACVLVSSVLFETAEIVPDLAVLAHACERHGVTLLVDAYHHLNVVPFDIGAMGLASACVTGGGYKYCQLGEGNCFLRIPSACNLRPVITGWFSEHSELADVRHQGEVRYGRGAAALAGATYDPTSHYRAAEVFAFHQRLELTPQRLRGISRHQVGLLQNGFEALDVSPAIASVEPIPAERRGGFLAIRTAKAAEAARALRLRSVFGDSRGDVLRLGPAPYVSDEQLRDAVSVLGEVLVAF